MGKLVSKIVFFFIAFALCLSLLKKCAQSSKEYMNEVAESISGIFSSCTPLSSTVVINQTTIQNIKVEMTNIQSQVSSIEQTIDLTIKKGDQNLLLEQYTQLNQYLVTVNTHIAELQGSDDTEAINLLKQLKKLQKQIKKILERIEAKLNQKEKDDDCYYAIGTESDLIEAQVIKKNWIGQLVVIPTKSNENPYYISGHKSTIGQLPLYAQEADVISDMPSSSYELRPINSQLILNIKDPDKFWNKTSHLVVVTK